MNQVNKFYLSSFLKNQTYFTPIMVLFLQFNNLNYTEIFWVYTIGSIFSMLMEIPTGIFADLFGKKKTMIISRFFTFCSFIVFGFSHIFWMFVLAQVLITVGKSFKSGTDVAYIYSYLEQKKKRISYTEIKGKQKFWARIGEAIATSVGGVIAQWFGFNMVFFFAAIPALMNIILMFTYEDIKEKKIKSNITRETSSLIKNSYKEIISNSPLIKVILNISFFVMIMTVSSTFIQPYMENLGISIQYFGFIYALFFIITAISVRYSYLFEKKYSKVKIINLITLISFIPLLLLGLGFTGYIGILFFFMIVIGENVRSPIANHEFHTRINSANRATLGSVLMMSRDVLAAIFLPLFGYIADVYSMNVVLIILSCLMLLNWTFFKITSQANQTS